jgi:hypothetical protein
MRGLERIAADRRHLVAAQVRCSTGFTWGRASDGRAVLAMPGPKREMRVRAMPASLPDVLLAWLARRPVSVFLPREADLPELLRLDPVAAEHLPAAWGVLAQRGVVRVRRGRAGSWQGEWLVAEMPAGRVHRSAGAPIQWAEGGA